jgi:2-amino-4-hydroxy-6-hydroxymethyldihydropteridine diphosphokinase
MLGKGGKSANIRSEVHVVPLAYLGLGSNLGNRRRNLEQAVARLNDTSGIHVQRVSSFRETEPFGVQDQPFFLNGVVEVETELDPPALLAAVKRIEQELGRTPTYRWGPRVIDLDILLYGSIRWESAELTIPHPGLLKRPFVTEPLGELAPDRLEELRRDASVPVRGAR